MLEYLSADIICSEKQTVFQERCSRKTASFEQQIIPKGKYPCKHIFAPNGGYCVYYASNLFRNARSFENWGISSDIPQFQLGNIQPLDAFRPIACERKSCDLMDRNSEQLVLRLAKNYVQTFFLSTFVFLNYSQARIFHCLVEINLPFSGNLFTQLSSSTRLGTLRIYDADGVDDAQ